MRRLQLLPWLTGGTILIILVASLAAPLITKHDPTDGYLETRLRPPPWQERGLADHPLGTDHQGRDVLSRLLYGARISLFVGFASVGIAGVVGTILGALAGYYGRTIDRIVTLLTDIQMAFPFLVLAIALVAVIGPGLRNIILVLALNGWVFYARIVRGEVLRLREVEFVVAGRALGATDLRLLITAILPNVWAPVLIVASFAFSQAIIVEASMSFLGVGVQPPTPTWGGMLADAREYMQLAWWPLAFPAVALAVLVLAINLLGDWLRDTLDPRIQT